MIREARPEDIPAMHECRDAAILEKAGDFYDQIVLEDWMTKENPKIFENDRKAMESGHWIYLLYEHKGTVYGMANASPEERKLGRIYARRGAETPVGQNLLTRLIELCREASCPYLDFDASLNSRDFYERNGAIVVEENAVYTSRRGLTVPCVKMRLVL